MSTHLLSMGVFLQQGLCVLGNSQHINLLNNKNTIVQCKPLLPGQSLYWLDASTVNLLESNDASTSLIYNVDYNLMHRRLGVTIRTRFTSFLLMTHLPYTCRPP